MRFHPRGAISRGFSFNIIPAWDPATLENARWQREKGPIHGNIQIPIHPFGRFEWERFDKYYTDASCAITRQVGGKSNHLFIKDYKQSQIAYCQIILRKKKKKKRGIRGKNCRAFEM